MEYITSFLKRFISLMELSLGPVLRGSGSQVPLRINLSSQNITRLSIYCAVDISSLPDIFFLPNLDRLEMSSVHSGESGYRKLPSHARKGCSRVKSLIMTGVLSEYHLHQISTWPTQFAKFSYEHESLEIEPISPGFFSAILQSSKDILLELKLILSSCESQYRGPASPYPNPWVDLSVFSQLSTVEISSNVMLPLSTAAESLPLLPRRMQSLTIICGPQDPFSILDDRYACNRRRRDFYWERVSLFAKQICQPLSRNFFQMKELVLKTSYGFEEVDKRVWHSYGQPSPDDILFVRYQSVGIELKILDIPIARCFCDRCQEQDYYNQCYHGYCNDWEYHEDPLGIIDGPMFGEELSEYSDSPRGTEVDEEELERLYEEEEEEIEEWYRQWEEDKARAKVEQVKAKVSA